MKKRSGAAIILVVSLIGVGIGTIIHNNFIAAKDIKVLEYKSAEDNKINSGKDIIESNESYRIQKVENFNATAWINNNEILNLIENGQYNIFTSDPYYTCSVYNVETKAEKHFGNVCIEDGEVYGVSPDGKYLLYKEGQDTLKFKDMTREELYSSDEIKSNIKLLDLTSGEIKNFEETNFLSSNKYKWIDNNTIICTDYDNKSWYIKNINGFVYEDGKIEGPMKILDAKNINVLGNKVQGEIYYTNDLKDENGMYTEYSLCKLNLATKESTEMDRFPMSYRIKKAGDTTALLMQGFTQEIHYLDKDFKLLKKVHDDTHTKSIFSSLLSNDGNKGAFIYSNEYLTEHSAGINIIDIKTGVMNEIVKVDNLKNDELQNDYILNYYFSFETNEMVEEKVFGPELRFGDRKVENDFAWSADGKSLIFTYKYNSKEDDKNHIDSYIVKYE